MSPFYCGQIRGIRLASLRFNAGCSRKLAAVFIPGGGYRGGPCGEGRSRILKTTRVTSGRADNVGDNVGDVAGMGAIFLTVMLPVRWRSCSWAPDGASQADREIHGCALVLCLLGILRL